MQTSELDRRLHVLHEIATQAGNAAMQYYDDKLDIEWKGKGNPVTAADHAANEVILAELHRHFPGEPVLSEESRDDMSRLGKNLVWVVDPLDGTKEFIAHNGEFAIMIGMIEGGRPVLGVVNQAATRSVYFGALGLGAWLSGPGGNRALRVSENAEPSKLRMVASRSHFPANVERVRRRLGIREILRSGSVGLKCGLIARGDCEVYLHPSSKVNLWDSCGPAAVLIAAGGVMTDIKGEPLDYGSVDVRHRKGLVATHGRLHEQIIAAIAQEGVQVDE